MTCSKKSKVIFIVGVLVALTAIPAFADARLQGNWRWEGGASTQLHINGSSFVWVWIDGTIFAGTVSVSGNVATLSANLVQPVNGYWRNHAEVWNYSIQFQANNNTLIINNWVYLRM